MDDRIRIVFFGTPEFAVPSLERLVAQPDFSVVLVVTQPDRPAGRGRRLQPPPVKTRALELGLPVMQPERLRDPSTIEEIARLEPSLGLVVAYGELIPKALLDVPPHGFLNVHPSLLPRYRGASPIQAAILNGDPITGVSVILLTTRLDAGPIVHQVAVPVAPDDTAGSLSARLACVAADILPEVVRAWIAGRIVPLPQDETQATYTQPLTKEDGRIDWSLPAELIERLVRAMQPWPTAWTTIRGRLVRILKVQIHDAELSLPPGCLVVTRDALLASTGRGTLLLETVQPEGKRPMSALDWWRGARLEPGACFDG